MKPHMAVPKCSKCGGVNDRDNQRYCRLCHASYMREHRLKYSELSASARRKQNSRSMAAVYQSRGLLQPMACEQCGDVDAEKHHEDYAKPLDVHWLCRPCHLAEHQRISQ
jgi:hypothetical protein